MRTKIKNSLIVIAIPVVVYLIFYLFQPNRFGSLQGIYIMLQQAFIPSILAWGLAFILTMGLYDFSIGGVLVLAAIIGADYGARFGFVGLIFGCLLIAIILELINCVAYIYLKIPSMIVTIGLLMIYETLGNLYKGGLGTTLPYELGFFGRAPYNLLIGITTFIIAYLIYNTTRYGIQIKSIGSSEIIAKSMGVNINKMKIMGFLICGIFVGIASIVTVSYGGIIMPQIGMNSLLRIFTPLMGCFIGIALKKYCNMIIGIFVGELILVMILTGLITIGVDTTFQQVIMGTFLLIIAGITGKFQREEVVKCNLKAILQTIEY